jgi:DNA-binding NtrC family response regulator
MREQGLRPLQLADDALQALQAYDWPGNVRELRTVMRHPAETATAGSIQALDLNISTRKSYPLVDAMPPAAEIPIPAEGRSLKDIEADDTSEAARVLQISPADLLRKIMSHGLEGLMALSDTA